MTNAFIALRNAELVERAVVTITRTITHYAAPTTTLVTATRKVTTTAVKPAPSPKVNDVKDEEPVEVKSNNENNPPAEQQASAETGDNSNATAEPVGEGKYRDIPGKAGIVYSPYKPGGCKTAEEIKSEMSKLGSYGLFRLYGVDCNQIANVLSIVKGMGPDKKMFIGVYNLKNWQAELDTLVSEVGDDWSYIHTVSIGNEAVHNGMDAGEVVSIVKQAKEKLRASGYNGPVVTTEALYKVLADPRLCEAMDYIGVNCHPFYDPNTSADKAGDFLQNQIETVKKTCGGNKEVLITGKFAVCRSCHYQSPFLTDCRDWLAP